MLKGVDEQLSVPGLRQAGCIRSFPTQRQLRADHWHISVEFHIILFF